MPALPLNKADAKVLITGANGYIGLWTVKTALERGYSVRAVVRSEGKSQSLKTLFGEYIANGNLEFVYVADLTEEGAFDEAVKDIDAILHLASPLPSNSPNPDDTIRPAVDGTLGILKSALNFGKDVKRIVITSSVAAVFTVQSEPRTFTEADWNERVVEQVQKEGVTAPNLIYRTSKVLAEKAAWNFYNTHKSNIPWDLTTINPPYVYGSSLEPNIASPSEISGTQKIWWDVVIDNSPEKKETLGPISERTRETLGPQGGNTWVSVVDLAEAHVRALEREEAGGERIIVSSGPYIWQEWLDTANRLAPPSIKAYLPKGYPELTSGKIAYHIQVDASKSERVLGLKYRTKEDMLKEVFAEIDRRGWVGELVKASQQ